MNLIVHLLTAGMLLLQASVAPAAYSATDMPLTNTVSIEDEENLPWTGERRLCWDDFKCAPLRNTEAVALTSTTLGITYKLRNGRFVYDINCAFAKQHSWGILKTPYILAHEQAHFDITELFARKLHRRLQQYRMNEDSFKQDINAIYKAVITEKEMFQEIYDQQTDHSRKKAKQEEWLLRIEAMLQDSAPFQNYP